MPFDEKTLANLRPPWKPGQSGNPKGRPSASITIEEWINVFAAERLTEDQLRAIARGKNEDWTRRTAADRALKTFETGDLADFEEVLDGEKKLHELRTAGVNTEIVKKCKTKRRTLDDGTVEVEREIELHNRSGEEFDRVMDRTGGKPMQRSENLNIEIHAAGQLNLAEMMQDLITLGVPREAWPPQVQAFAERETKVIESKVVE